MTDIIETERELLNKMIEELGLSHPEVLAQSEKLDKLIAGYQNKQIKEVENDKNK